MTSALNTQEITSSQAFEATHVTMVVEKSQYEQSQIEEKLFKKLRVQVSSIPASTIDLTNSEEEDERISPVPVIVETGNGNDLQDFMNLFNGNNGKSSSTLPQSQPSSQLGPSSYPLLLSSIIALSSFSTGSTMTPFMSQLYQNATCLPLYITPVSLQMPIPSSTTPPFFKVPLHIPSFSSIPYSVHEKASTLSQSSLQTTIM